MSWSFTACSPISSPPSAIQPVNNAAQLQWSSATWGTYCQGCFELIFNLFDILTSGTYKIYLGNNYIFELFDETTSLYLSTANIPSGSYQWYVEASLGGKYSSSSLVMNFVVCVFCLFVWK